MTSNKSTSKLSKIFPALKAMIFVAGASSLQACFLRRTSVLLGPAPYAYGPAALGYALRRGSPAYAYGSAAARVGDYDEHHSVA